MTKREFDEDYARHKLTIFRCVLKILERITGKNCRVKRH